jgi:hypothetical protein
MVKDSEPVPFTAGASRSVGKLMVLLRDQGLLDNDDIQAILRRALANVAPPSTPPLQAAND